MHKLIRALTACNHGRPPLWLMRQAGRYLPEYKALRAKHSFLEMCHNPELVAEVTQMPLRHFALDAAILFSDILVIPEAMGVGLSFDEGKGPIIARPLKTAQDIDRLPIPDVSDALGYVSEGIRYLIPQLKVPLLGFCGAPFTVASYMIEGGSSRDLRKTKLWMLQDPASFHKLLDKITDMSISYLHMQARAGVQAIQIFDSWVHVLTPVQFDAFVAPCLKKIVDAVKNHMKIPVILFSRGSAAFATRLAALAPSAVSVDWSIDIPSLRREIPRGVSLQGNLDPDILLTSPSIVRKEAARILESMDKDPGFIFNLGHGILPETPLENVRALVETVHELSDDKPQ